MDTYTKIIKSISSNNLKNQKYNYQDEVPYTIRCVESQKIVKMHPTFVPVIVNTKEDIELKKRKFLVPYHIYSSILIYHIRKHISNLTNKSIFLFYNNIMLDRFKNIGDAYIEYILSNSNDDKYFYLDLHFENTFGN
jgi:hypothetical protein